VPLSRRHRPVWAEVDMGALERNAARMRDIVAPALLCAVVKADAYGHGAVHAARAFLAGGASWLAVAMVEEGAELRDAGISAPVLVLSEPPASAMEDLVAYDLSPTVYTTAGVEALGAAALRLGRRVGVHVKVDTGMHRVGASGDDVLGVVEKVVASGPLWLEGLWSHLAVADRVSAEDDEFTRHQLRLFEEVADALRGEGIRPRMLHLANSAGSVRFPACRHDMVRSGIALYGAMDLAVPEGLEPALSLRAEVSFVRELPAGARPSYGRARALPERSLVATVPIGYADGVPRRYFEVGGTVLIGGRECPLAGVVTMDQIMVDCTPAGHVSPGDEVVLIGRQGQLELDAREWARRLQTISYEVLTGIGWRVPRVPVREGG